MRGIPAQSTFRFEISLFSLSLGEIFMKKTIGMLAIVFVVFALTASLALAQQRQGGPGGPGPGGMGFGGETRFMLTEEGQKDLGLTSDDVTKLREALRPAAPAQRNQNATPEERREAAEKAATETAKKVAAVLSKDQLEKVQTRAFQLGGYAGLSGRYAQAALNLTDEQKTKIAAIARENRPAQGQGGGPGGGQNVQNMTEAERTQMRERMAESRRVLGEKFKDVLTADQKAKADELLKNIPAYIKEIQDRPAGFGAGGNRGGAGGGPAAGGGGNRGGGTGGRNRNN